MNDGWNNADEKPNMSDDEEKRLKSVPRVMKAPVLKQGL